MLSIALIITVRLAAQRPNEIVFVRHGETQANATGRYNSRTIDTFSDKGEREVADLTRQLDRMRFDTIVVSPSPRALKTIAPYLRAHHYVAQIWPELYECCDGNTKKIKGLTSLQIRYGATIKIPPEFAGLFQLEAGNSRFILAPSYEDGLRQIKLAGNHLKTLSGTGLTVLVVGHSLQGGRMIEYLEGKPMTGKTRPENAKLLRFRESGSGNFLPEKAK